MVTTLLSFQRTSQISALQSSATLNEPHGFFFLTSSLLRQASSVWFGCRVPVAAILLHASKLGSLMVTCLTCNPELTRGCRFDSAPGHCRLTTLGKLFTYMFLCHQAVIFGSRVWFLGSANLTVSFIFTPDRPPLPWQRNFGQNGR